MWFGDESIIWMKFEWDENKRQLNLKRHGIDFIGVEKIFENDNHTIVDDRLWRNKIRYFRLF
jgi:uncharacterized protein